MHFNEDTSNLVFDSWLQRHDATPKQHICAHAFSGSRWSNGAAASWTVFHSPAVCPPLRVDVLFQEYPCLHGRVSLRTTSGGASIAVSTWMAGRPTWYPTKSHDTSYIRLSAAHCGVSLCEFPPFSLDFRWWGRLNSLGVQEVSQCLQEGSGNSGGERNWSAQVQ